MNIDLRDIDSDFENAINTIKINLDISTNTKAVRECVVNYLDLIDKIKHLETKNYLLKNELNSLKNDTNDFIDAFERLKSRAN